MKLTVQHIFAPCSCRFIPRRSSCKAKGLTALSPGGVVQEHCPTHAQTDRGPAKGNPPHCVRGGGGARTARSPARRQAPAVADSAENAPTAFALRRASRQGCRPRSSASTNTCATSWGTQCRLVLPSSTTGRSSGSKSSPWSPLPCERPLVPPTPPRHVPLRALTSRARCPPAGVL